MQLKHSNLLFINSNIIIMKKSIFTGMFIMLLTGQLFAQQSNTIALDLTNPTNPASFVFTDGGYWEHTYNDEDYTFFKSQIFSFSHLIEGKGSAYGGYAWNGFTVCNSGDNTDYSYTGSWVPNYEWGCMAGGGIKTDTQGNIMTDENGVVLVQKGLPYLVGFWNNLMEPQWWHYGYSMAVEPTRCLQIHLDKEEEYEAVGVYVNMHPYTYYANKNGFGVARPLNQEGDYYKLIIHGYNPDGTESGKSVEYIMTKFESGQLHQSSKWEWVNLSSLGAIGGFYCTIVSTDSNYLGPKSPVYFCMDKLQVRKKTVGIEESKWGKVNIYSYRNTVYINNVDTWRISTSLNDHATSLPTIEIWDMAGRLIHRSIMNAHNAAITLQVAEGIYNVVLRMGEWGGRDAMRCVSRVFINR
jgi:hypothetical protein